MSFSADVTRFCKLTSIKSDKAVRLITLYFVREMVQMTPVDTGAARSNWFFGFAPVYDVSERFDRQGGPTFGRLEAFIEKVYAGDSFYITNNLPYIMALEYGHSKQAPKGMARRAVARWNGIVQKIGRDLGDA